MCFLTPGHKKKQDTGKYKSYLSEKYKIFDYKGYQLSNFEKKIVCFEYNHIYN